MLGVNDLDRRWKEDEPGRLSLTDTVRSASDLVKDIELLLRIWFLMAGDFGRISAGRAK